MLPTALTGFDDGAAPVVLAPASHRIVLLAAGSFVQTTSIAPGQRVAPPAQLVETGRTTFRPQLGGVDGLAATSASDGSVLATWRARNE